MERYPSIQNVGSLRNFIKQIPTLGVPPKIIQQYLESVGLKSKNDRPIITILRFINFVDESGSPTDNYKLFRNKEKSGMIMAASLKKAYGELFQTYSDAQNRDNEALRNYFSTVVSGGEAVLSNTVGTFKALCEFADFGAPSAEPPIASESVGKVPLTTVSVPTVASRLTINVNIELQLPATEDTTIYDKIFQSLKKHLLER